MELTHRKCLKLSSLDKVKFKLQKNHCVPLMVNILSVSQGNPFKRSGLHILCGGFFFFFLMTLVL